MTSDEFRAIRLSLGLSQSELGEVMGMRAADVSRIETRRAPTKQQAAFIRYIAETRRD